MGKLRVMLNEDVAALLGDSPEQIERTALEMIVLHFYRLHQISAGRAAQLLNLD